MVKCFESIFPRGEGIRGCKGTEALVCQISEALFFMDSMTRLSVCVPACLRAGVRARARGLCFRPASSL